MPREKLQIRRSCWLGSQLWIIKMQTTETHFQELKDKRGNIFNTMRTQGYFKGSKTGRRRGGMDQSVIQQTFNWTLNVSQAPCWILIVLLLWLHLNSLLLFLALSLIGFIWFFCGNSPNKQSLSTMCPYASWSLVSAKASRFWVWILSSKKRESRELIGWVYYNQVVE